MKKLKKLGVLVLFAVVLMVILCYAPDLLFHLRQFLKIIPLGSSVIISDISDDKYIDIMISPICSCVAIVISLRALKTARANLKTNIVQQEANDIASALTVRDFIEENMREIIYIRRDAGDFDRLIADDKIIELTAHLYASKKIEKADLLIIVNFFEKIKRIIRFHQEGDPDKAKARVEDFCKKYFKEDSTDKSTEIMSVICALEKTIDSGYEGRR